MLPEASPGANGLSQLWAQPVSPRTRCWCWCWPTTHQPTTARRSALRRWPPCCWDATLRPGAVVSTCNSEQRWPAVWGWRYSPAAAAFCYLTSQAVRALSRGSGCAVALTRPAALIPRVASAPPDGFTGRFFRSCEAPQPFPVRTPTSLGRAFGSDVFIATPRKSARACSYSAIATWSPFEGTESFGARRAPLADSVLGPARQSPERPRDLAIRHPASESGTDQVGRPRKTSGFILGNHDLPIDGQVISSPLTRLGDSTSPYIPRTRVFPISAPSRSGLRSRRCGCELRQLGSRGIYRVVDMGPFSHSPSL